MILNESMHVFERNWIILTQEMMVFLSDYSCKMELTIVMNYYWY